MSKAMDQRSNMFPHELNKFTFWQELTLFYVVLYAAAAASFLGHRVFYIQLPFFRLSSYRLLLITIAFWMVYRLAVKKLAFSMIVPKTKSSFSVWVFIVWTVYALVSFFWVRDRSGWFRAVFFIAAGTFIIIVENYYFSSVKKIKLALFVSFAQKYRHSTERDTKVLAMGFMAFQVIFVLGSVSSSSNIIRDWLWVVWGIIIAFQGIGENDKKSQNSNAVKNINKAEQ